MRQVAAKVSLVRRDIAMEIHPAKFRCSMVVGRVKNQDPLARFLSGSNRTSGIDTASHHLKTFNCSIEIRRGENRTIHSKLWVNNYAHA